MSAPPTDLPYAGPPTILAAGGWRWAGYPSCLSFLSRLLQAGCNCTHAVRQTPGSIRFQRIASTGPTTAGTGQSYWMLETGSRHATTCMRGRGPVLVRVVGRVNG